MRKSLFQIRKTLGLLWGRAAARRTPGTAADWLPPVLGPGDWATGLMADRSTGWYFDRR
jgi:hypothetical protein